MSTDDIKREIRRRIKALREADPYPDPSSIINAVVSLPEWQNAGTVMLYCALPGEVDLAALMDMPGRKVVLPLVCGDDLLLKEYVPGRLVPGYAGIMEPAADAPDVAPSSIDLVIVPGVAFDRNGGRLGRGKGYYDRTLSKIAAVKIGVAFSWQLVETVPMDAWDRPMDILIVDGDVIKGRK